MLPHSDLEQHKQERARLRLGVEGSTWSDSIGLDQVYKPQSCGAIDYCVWCARAPETKSGWQG